MDTALTLGDEVTMHYDALIAKLVAWGRDRNEAIARMRGALDEFQVGGFRTTIPFHREILRDPDFLAGRFDTGYVERILPRITAALQATGPHAEAAAMLAVIAATEESLGRPASPSAPGPSAWALAGRRAQMESRSIRPLRSS